MEEFLIWLMMGLVEGLTDIFPISSTAHLSLAREILSVSHFDLSLAAGLHSGSLIAITAFFLKEMGTLWNSWKDSLKSLRGWIGGQRNSLDLSPDTVTPYLYGLSLIPVAVEGLTLRNVAQDIFTHKYQPLLFLILNGIIILITALFAQGERTIKELGWSEFFFIGMIQGLAVVPGISRLGLVLCTGLWCRLKWQEAVKLTFVLSIPVVIGALLVEFRNITFLIAGESRLLFVFSAGTCSAFLGSWLGLKLLTSRLLERRKLALFGYYCVMLGSFSALYLYFWK
jgi:undecaprenyl-diphosphatase